MKDHCTRNNLWDEQQLGATSGVLGTTDQLLVDECIMQQVKDKHLNLCVAYNDYKTAYDRVRHDWMLMVYKWMGIPEQLIELLKTIMSKWKTRLEICESGLKVRSRVLDINTGFLQGDSYAATGF